VAAALEGRSVRDGGSAPLGLVRWRAGIWNRSGNHFVILFNVKVCAYVPAAMLLGDEFAAEALELIAAFVILHTIQF
jgi:hypothetical protein